MQRIEQEKKLEESKVFLKTVLLPTLDDESCIDNELALQLALQSLSDSDSSDSDDEEEVITKPTATTFDVFSRGKHTENNFFVSLNLVGDRLMVDDEPPFKLNIIARNNESHLLLDQALDSIASTYKCVFEHDISKYPGYNFQNWVSSIELNENNLLFLKDLFKDNKNVIDLFNKVESKLLAFNSRNRGYQTLITHLTKLHDVASLDVLENAPIKESIVYFSKQNFEADFANLTATDLAQVLSGMTYAYISMSKKDYALLNSYFNQINKLDNVKVFREEPFIVAIKFADVNEAGKIVLNSDFSEKNKDLDPTINKAFQDQVETLEFIFEKFHQTYDNKLHEFYKKEFNQQKENTTVILSACRKPSVFTGSFQSDVGLYKSQCQIGFFITDQMQSGLKENISALAKIDIPDIVLQGEHGDTILANMLGGYSDSRQKKTVSAEKPAIYAGWDYGLKFADFDPALQKIYCNRGRELDKDNLTLVIPLPNLILYFMLRYLDNLAANALKEIFNEIMKHTVNFIVNYKLPLPQKYHDVFFNSSFLSEEDKTTIHQIYDQLLVKQVNDREEFLKLDALEEITTIAYVDSDSEDDATVEILSVEKIEQESDDEVIEFFDVDNDESKIKDKDKKDVSFYKSGLSVFNNEFPKNNDLQIKNNHEDEKVNPHKPEPPDFKK